MYRKKEKEGENMTLGRIAEILEGEVVLNTGDMGDRNPFCLQL